MEIRSFDPIFQSRELQWHVNVVVSRIKIKNYSVVSARLVKQQWQYLVDQG